MTLSNWVGSMCVCQKIWIYSASKSIEHCQYIFCKFSMLLKLFSFCKLQTCVYKLFIIHFKKKSIRNFTTQLKFFSVCPTLFPVYSQITKLYRIIFRDLLIKWYLSAWLYSDFFLMLFFTLICSRIMKKVNDFTFFQGH